MRKKYIDQTFEYKVGEVGDFKILRYQIPGWDQLTSKQRQLLFYLYNASMWGRDIIWDQNFKYGLHIRRVMELILEENWFSGPSELTEEDEWNHFLEYVKLMYIGNGIHHPWSGEKIIPKFSTEYFIRLINTIRVPATDYDLLDIIFNPKAFPNRTNRKKGDDLVQTSAANFYSGVTQKEAEKFYKNKPAEEHPAGIPLPHGMNSQLVKENGVLTERVWSTSGMYGPELSKMVHWLEKAVDAAENKQQAAAFHALIKFYNSGSLTDFNNYCIKWLEDRDSAIDIIHGFIEDYTDPIGRKCTYEAILSVCDPEQSKRIRLLQEHGQWFEDNSTTALQHKKEKVVGIDARVINVVTLAGDSSPCPPIGVNLPNGKELREKYGSKAVNLDNIVNSYDEVKKETGAWKEFYLPEVAKMVEQYADSVDKIHTDMHEVLGHGSGKILPGAGGLGEYSAVIEEARADLFALYHITSPKCVEIGLLPSKEAAQVSYDTQMTNGLLAQMIKLKPHETALKQAHMRNRQLIASWCLEHTDVMELVERDGKTYVQISDYDKLRATVGELLKEVQRITSEGDKKAAEHLVETYATDVNKKLHKEVLERWEKYNIKPYSAFINPVISPEGKIMYPDDFLEQQYGYSKAFSTH